MKTINFGRIAILIICLTAAVAFKGEKDKLHKRNFLINISEPKKPKTTPDEMQFKDGKVWSGDQAFEKLGGVKLIRYEMVKDSTYMDEDVEVEYIEILATSELEKDESFELKCVIDNFEISGTMKLLKKGKDKKVWGFTGKEKPKPVKKK